ncbi:MAG: hypothetical protein SGJ11_15545 [Phycisphaerae bacterium]|nr:hypothetical protein [Phycisphaerae bacterium]
MTLVGAAAGVSIAALTAAGIGVRSFIRPLSTRTAALWLVGAVIVAATGSMITTMLQLPTSHSTLPAGH